MRNICLQTVPIAVATLCLSCVTFGTEGIHLMDYNSHKKKGNALGGVIFPAIMLEHFFQDMKSGAFHVKERRRYLLCKLALGSAQEQHFTGIIELLTTRK